MNKNIKLIIKREQRELVEESMKIIEPNLVSLEINERKPPYGTFGLTGIEIAATITATVAVINLALNIYDRLKPNEEVKLQVEEKEKVYIVLISLDKTKEEITNQIQNDGEFDTKLISE